MADIKELIKKKSSEIFDEIVTIRRMFHQNPELSTQEFATAEIIHNILFDLGIEHQTGIAGTGIVGVIYGEKGSGKIIGLRADMDALPILEASGVGFTSLNKGVMHACGHDMHMASLIGCVKILNELKEHFSGGIKFIFQPSEEKYPGGAIQMIKEGVLQNPKVDSMLGMHVMPELPMGVVGLKPEKYMASTDEIYITISGRGGHAANPHQNIDPIVIGSQVVIALQQIVSRYAPPSIPTVISFGRFEGLGRTNIIPDEVKLEGTIRTFDEKWRKKTHQLIEEIACGTATSFGAKCLVFIDKGYPFIYNNPELTERLKQSAICFLNESEVVDLDLRMTAEDFSYFAKEVPSCFYRIGVAFDKEEIFNLHSSKFKLNEKSIANAIGLMSWFAYSELMR